MQTPINTLSLARKFIGRFGFGPISVESFDIFIIDHYLAADPETSDTTDGRYIKFVQERTKARGKLNKVGGDADERFQIVAHTRGEYMVAEYNEAIRESTAAISQQVRRYAEGKSHNLARMAKKIDRMLLEAPEDAELLTTAAMVEEMVSQSTKLATKVAGLTHQYQVAWNAVEERFLALGNDGED
jgi:hypothetical protein